MKKSHKIILLFIFLTLAVLAGFFLFKKSEKVKNETLPEIEKIVEIIPEGPLRIGFITDVHCYADLDKKTNQWNLNWRCRKPLEAFVKKMNEDYKPDFVIENGDLIDGKDKRARETFIEADKIYETIMAPKYHVLGNHETRSFIKSDWLGLVSYEKPYYSFVAKGYQIIVLDGNNKMAVGGNVVDTSPDSESYPGLIDSTQMEWLKKLLNESKGYQKIVFVHQPLATEETKTQEQLFIKGKELRDLFSRNKVKAVFSGHIERFCLMQENGVDYYVIKGFWKENKSLKDDSRFKNEGIFSEILIDNGTIEVNAYRNPDIKNEKNPVEYQLMKITLENANCSDGSNLYVEEEIPAQ